MDGKRGTCTELRVPLFPERGPEPSGFGSPGQIRDPTEGIPRAQSHYLVEAIPSAPLKDVPWQKPSGIDFSGRLWYFFRK
jgi:hypothetical protein